MTGRSLLGTLPLLGFAAVVAILGWRSLAWPLVHDAPIMHYIAWRIAEGAVPYRDLFDMNFPGVYLLHLAVLGVAGAGDTAWRVFDLAWLALGSLAVAALAAPWGVVAAAGGGLFFAAHHLAGGAWMAGQRDFLLCPFLLLGALGVARWLEHRRFASLAYGGLALGAGITVKPHAAAFAAALLVLVAGVAWHRGSPGRPAAIFGAALAAGPVAVLVWLGAAGGLAAWREIVFEYLVPLYAPLARPARWGFHRWHVWIAVGAAVLASLGEVVWRRRFTWRHGVVVIGLGYGLAHYFAQGKGWEYHVYPLAAFAAVALCAGLAPLARLGPRLAAVPLAGVLAAVALLLGAKGVEAARAPWIEARARRVEALVTTLQGRLGRDDLVQVLDTTEGGVHALLRLGARQPTRFLYDFHFYHDVQAPMIQGLRAELAGDLEAHRPRFIVLFERGWPAGGYERLTTFPGLARRLDAGYRVETRGDGYVIYAQRHDP